MANFDLYARFLKSWEGGYSNHPQDGGGETYKGITIGTWTDYCKKKGLQAKLTDMTEAQWKEIMKGGYWDKVGGDDIASQGVANMVADWAVNAGTRTAARALQRLSGAEVDGIVGPKTLKQVNAMAEGILFIRLRDARLTYYREFVRKRPAKKTFLAGWERRTKSIRLHSMVLNDKTGTEVRC